MVLAAGTRLGTYEITGTLGAGGMGEVYRAHDTSLKRDVAIKVLPASFASDADRLARFQREAEVLASLNHPNIAHVYGIERSDETTALAMELVEGPTLADRIAQGPLPVGEALGLAMQIAEALEAAHGRGIVHRDLKPANIKLTSEGTVKVLDFGIAKAPEPSTTSGGHSPTRLTPALTEAGVLLGTAAYMAPEQARGKNVDQRADIWAFGCVLYEMLTGQPAFDGEDVAMTLARVLANDTDLKSMPGTISPAVRQTIKLCLEKDVRKRIADIRDVKLALQGAFETAGPRNDAASSAPRRRLGWLVIVVVAAAVTAAVVWTIKPASRSDAQRFVAEIPATPDTPEAFYDGFALSPDGSMLAYAARTTSGTRQVWVRQIAVDGARALPGTEGGTYPFWSPDGRSVAFFAGTRLKRVDVDGTRLQTICSVPADTFISGSWGTSGDILWAWRSLIFKVRSTGGMPVALEALGDGSRPVWLADGRRFLFARATDGGLSVRLASADSTESQLVKHLVSQRPDISFTLGGDLLFFNQDNALMAQRLDEASGTLVGIPVPLTRDAGTPLGWFAVSSNGQRLAALVREAPGSVVNPGSPITRLTWVDRQGRTLGVLGEPDNYWSVRLAPDGESAGVNRSTSLWLLRPDGRDIRLANEAGGLWIGTVWAHDGTELVSKNLRKGVMRLSVGVDEPPVPLTNARGRQVTDWSRDGRWLLTEQIGKTASVDILAYDVAHDASTAWLATAANESSARFSPDGLWVAYTSDASGSANVYLRRFDGAGQPIRVSTAGGDYPAWRRDGDELFFLSPRNELMSVSLGRSGESLTVGEPQKLFSRALERSSREIPYDAAPDGQRFLLNLLPDRAPSLFFLQGLDAMMGKN